MLGIVLELDTVKEKFAGGIIPMLTVGGEITRYCKNHNAPFVLIDLGMDVPFCEALELRRIALLEEPGKAVRDQDHVIKRNTLIGVMRGCGELGIKTNYYIRKTFPETEWDARYIQAGYGKHAISATDSPECGLMMVDMNTFWVNHGEAMVTLGKAPTEFATTVSDAKADQILKQNAFRDALTADLEAGNARMNLLNPYYDDVMTIDEVGKMAYKGDATTRAFVTYSKVLSSLHPPHQVVQLVHIKKASRKTIKNAVMDKPITNMGTGDVDVYNFDLPITPENKHTLHHGETMDNNLSKSLVFVVTSTTDDGEIRTTRLVNADH